MVTVSPNGSSEAATGSRANAAPVLRGVRGAITVERDEPELIVAAVREMLQALLDENGLALDSIVSALFTSTADLLSDYPARGARQLGWTEIPLLCAAELPVRGAMARVIRVLLHVSVPDARPLRAVYLRDASALRPDLKR
jgi:chorismate mutase